MAIIFWSPLFAQQSEYPTVTAAVFEDANQNGVQDGSETLLSGWQFFSFDSVGNEIDRSLSGSLYVSLEFDPGSTFCLEAQAGWAISPRSLESDWCINSGADTSSLLFAIYVDPNSNPIEGLPSVIDDQPETPIAETGSVLGAVDEPQVLAETGVEAVLLPILGLLSIISVISLARMSVVR